NLKEIIDNKDLSETAKYRAVKRASGAYGAMISALKKQLLSDFVCSVLLKIASDRNQNLSYHTAQNIISMFLDRTIDNRKVLSLFSNTTLNDEKELVKTKKKRTATNKIDIDYKDIKKIYVGTVKAKLELFEQGFVKNRRLAKEKYRDQILTGEEINKLKEYSKPEKNISTEDE
ncbi:hypothetical protein, partial [Klebsiella pneumoniae]|uniref:hypothetical protein n=1 Tax=Klebsiella pneumoniae TaxID=573 RepID=UPI001C8C93F0